MALTNRNPIWPPDWPGPSYPDRPTLFDLLARASERPDLLQALAEDPLGTCKQWGVAVNADAVKVWLGFEPDNVSDEELLQILRSRLLGKQCSA
jgi:hypothetical protein